jgi:CheY-like chemotaxis protein
MTACEGSAATGLLSVLYVEDFALGAALVRDTLGRRAPEIRIEIVSNVAQAIEELKRFERERANPAPAVPDDAAPATHYDVVLTDLNLPDGLGLEILSHIRSRRLMLPVVILTGSVEQDTLQAALQAGADGYLAKRDNYLARLPAELHGAVQRFRAVQAAMGAGG